MCKYVVGCLVATETVLLHLFEDSNQWFVICMCIDLEGNTVMVKFPNQCSLPSASLPMLLYLVSTLDNLLLARALGCNAVMSGASSWG